MEHKTSYKIIISVLIMVLICAALFWTNCFAQKEANTSANKEKETATGSADLIKSIWGDNKKVLMKGNVVFVHTDTTIKSDLVEYDQNAKIAVSPGKLNISNPDCDISAEKGSVDFKNKTSFMENNVKLLIKPKESDNKELSEIKKPTTITCSKLEYKYKAKLAVLTGLVKFEQESRWITANSAEYDLNKEILILKGNIHGEDKDGQSFYAPEKVIISLKKGDEWMEAPNSKATFKIEVE
jgi:lipopolysaccharide assembly outer membrane protein LptD (OstA)